METTPQKNMPFAPAIEKNKENNQTKAHLKQTASLHLKIDVWFQRLFPFLALLGLLAGASSLLSRDNWVYP